jgi:tetratricopeptide (TPR) repeat protein
VRRAVFILLLAFGFASGAVELTLTDEGQLVFARELFERGEFFKAVLEYERLVSLFPESPLVDDAAFGVGLSYDGAGEYGVASSAYRQFLADFPSSELVPRVRLALGRSLALAHNYPDARRELEILAGESPPLETSGRARVLRGLTFLPVWELERAEADFLRAAADFPGGPVAVLGSRLAEIAARRAELPRVNPGLASLFSALVPGLGQVVAGDFWDGVLALTTNALWIGAAWWAADEGETATAVLTGFIGAGFYLGNVYNAGQAAEEANRRAVATLAGEIALEVRRWEAEHGAGLTLVPSP